MTDFGADVPFGKCPDKLKEHYGIEINKTACQKITEKHANNFLQKQEEKIKSNKDLGENKKVIAQIDGCMVPVVEFSTDKNKDKRKNKKVCYREARLSLAHTHRSKDIICSGEVCDVEKAGSHLKHCVESIGINKNTQIHIVADGAQWIENQIDEQFGGQANYLIDFYHVSEYLAEAANEIFSDSKSRNAWRKTQQDLLKDNSYGSVLEEIKKHIKKDASDDCKVNSCYRYIKNRTSFLNYKEAIANELPIGSGEIESAHRYIIQKRLKISGSWWLIENIDAMLALRCFRAANYWNEYWAELGNLQPA